MREIRQQQKQNRQKAHPLRYYTFTPAKPP